MTWSFGATYDDLLPTTTPPLLNDLDPSPLLRSDVLVAFLLGALLAFLILRAAPPPPARRWGRAEDQLGEQGELPPPDAPSARSSPTTSGTRSGGEKIDLLNSSSLSNAFAINAAVPTERSSHDLSLLLYSLYGADFYPGYFHGRFSMRNKHAANLKQLRRTLERRTLEVEQVCEKVEARER